MTPEQIDAVETSLAAVAVDELSDRFYVHLFERDPALQDLFAGDLDGQRVKFGAELAFIAAAIRRHDDFLERVRRLAVVHRQHGVRAVDVRIGAAALLAAFADVLGPAWTPELARSWALAYHLTTEAMLAAMAASPSVE